MRVLPDRTSALPLTLATIAAFAFARKIREVKLWNHRDKDVKHFVKSFPRGLPPQRGEHHPDGVNSKVVCAWLRDRPRPKLTIRIRLKLARMSIKAQVWRQSQCGAPHARRDPRPHLARRRAQANSEVIRYKRAAQRRQLMLYVLGETTTTVEETEPPKAIVIDEEEAARKKKRRAKTKAGALGRMMRLVNKARGRPDTGSMSDATSGAFGGLAQAHNPCDLSGLPGLPVVTPHVISEQHRPPTPAQPGRASMTTMAQLDPAVRQRWWT